MNANVIVKYFIYIIIFYIKFFIYIDYWVKHSKRKMLCSYFLVSEWFSRFTNNYHEIATFIPSAEKSL